MGASPFPIVTNVFLNYFEIQCLADCWVYRRYLDDTFLIFNNKQPGKQFCNFINNNINFTFGGDSDGMLAYLEINVNREDNIFTTSVSRKKTFTGQGMNFFHF